MLGSQLSHGDDFSAASGESSTFPGAKDSEGWHRMASGLGDIPLILIDHIYIHISLRYTLNFTLIYHKYPIDIYIICTCISHFSGTLAMNHPSFFLAGFQYIFFLAHSESGICGELAVTSSGENLLFLAKF